MTCARAGGGESMMTDDDDERAECGANYTIDKDTERTTYTTPTI